MLLKLKGGTAGSTLTGDLKDISTFKQRSGTSYIPTLVAFKRRRRATASPSSRAP